MYSQLYFDYNATTPCDKRVLDAMLPFFHDDFGNPSSSHHPYGWMAKNAIEESTERISKHLEVAAETLIYTSGATESINMIIKGVCNARKHKGNHIITSKGEHKAVLDTCKVLENEGFNITYLNVNTDGKIPLEEYKKAILPETILIATLYANNETGVIQPLEDIGLLARQNDITLFADATQALGKISLKELFKAVDFACFSAHKVYGPKGVGLVYFKPESTKNLLPSFIQGGGQQQGLRGGTLNTPGVVGFAEAVELAYNDLESEAERLAMLRDRLEEGILKIELSVVNGNKRDRLPNTTNISFKYVDGPSLLRALSNKLAVSNGSACNSASVEPSHVLMAMGIEKDLAYASLRFSLGRYTTGEDVEQTIAIISDEIKKQRANNILWERRGVR